MSLLVRSLIVASATVVVPCALLSRSHDQRPPIVDVSLDGGSSAVSGTDGDDVAAGTVDLYGNDVNDAVAKYSLDATGTLYEVHSPQTEIPKLGSPKS